MKDKMRLKFNAVWANPNMVSVNEMDYVCKMNEMEMNDEINELDFGTWNEEMNIDKWNEWYESD